jgi:WD40 repeat protein
VKFIFSPDSRLTASLSGDRSVQLWEVDGGSIRHIFQGKIWGNEPLFSPDEQWLLVPFPHEVHLWNVTTGELVRSINCYSDFGVFTLSPDARTMAVAYSNENITLTQGGSTNDGSNDDADADEDELRLFGSRAPHSISPVTVPPAVGLWDLTTGALLHVIKWCSEYTRHLAFAPDGRAIAFGPHQKTSGKMSSRFIPVWNMQTETLTSLGDFLHYLCALEWSPDGRHLAAVIVDNMRRCQIQIWTWLAERPDQSSCAMTRRTSHIAEMGNSCLLPSVRVSTSYGTSLQVRLSGSATIYQGRSTSAFPRTERQLTLASVVLSWPHSTLTGSQEVARECLYLEIG